MDATTSPPPPSTVSLDAVSIELPLQLYWRDQDAYGHVNNGVYLRWFEEARVRLFSEHLPDSILHMIVKAEINYRTAVEYPADLSIRCWIASSGNSSLILKYDIYKHSDGQKSTVCDGSGVIVLWDQEQQCKRQVSDFFTTAG